MTQNIFFDQDGERVDISESDTEESDETESDSDRYVQRYGYRRCRDEAPQCSRPKFKSESSSRKLRRHRRRSKKSKRYEFLNFTIF